MKRSAANETSSVQVPDVENLFADVAAYRSNQQREEASMDDAINELQIALEIAEKSAPIHEAEGQHEQAQRNRERAQSYREAIYRLQQPMNGGDVIAKAVAESQAQNETA